jgi:hypothetical protein
MVESPVAERGVLAGPRRGVVARESASGARLSSAVGVCAVCPDASR